MKTKTPENLRTTLDKLAQADRLRSLKTINRLEPPFIQLEGKEVVNFCSNDYLGFSQHPCLIETACNALEKYGVGTGSARLIGGTLDLHTRLEEKICNFKETAAAMVFNSGYQANIGVLSALAGRNDIVFSDKLNHASLLDGAILSRAKHYRYPHLDIQYLEKMLKSSPSECRKFIVTDTVFSMDGDQAGIEELYDLAERFNAWLILDEAHATGLFGARRRSGLWEKTGLNKSDRVIHIGTFSKALGGFGAYVAASRDVIDTLIQFSRSFVYSTSLPPSVIASNIKAIDLLVSDSSYTDRLWNNIETFKSIAIERNIDIKTESAIIPIFVGSDGDTIRHAKYLLENGFYVQPIRPPTVPEGTSRLRITLCSQHTEEQIRNLTDLLNFTVVYKSGKKY